MNKNIFEKTEGEGWNYTHNEIINRISELYINCPECETVIHDDEQYQCCTCGGGSRINVRRWVEEKLKK